MNPLPTSIEDLKTKLPSLDAFRTPLPILPLAQPGVPDTAPAPPTSGHGQNPELFGIDPRHLVQDAAARPDHYSPDQLELIGHLERGTTPPHPTSQRGMIELVYTFTRSTEVKQRSRRIITEASKPKPQELEEGPTFEDQKFGDMLRPTPGMEGIRHPKKILDIG